MYERTKAIVRAKGSIIAIIYQFLVEHVTHKYSLWNSHVEGF